MIGVYNDLFSLLQRNESAMLVAFVVTVSL